MAWHGMAWYEMMEETHSHNRDHGHGHIHIHVQFRRARILRAGESPCNFELHS